ncbi:unnamed protein product [Protopolystoma xenopodis]|uniref:Uncharacterized protein n=1 Tax=Protopolystoma xenopodis TaxID=117903 RepID=A0A448WBA2_9PLAT|nr:unnamed protein product [Protopolystoma xenopodis]
MSGNYTILATYAKTTGLPRSDCTKNAYTNDVFNPNLVHPPTGPSARALIRLGQVTGPASPSVTVNLLPWRLDERKSLSTAQKGLPKFEQLQSISRPNRP